MKSPILNRPATLAKFKHLLTNAEWIAKQEPSADTFIKELEAVISSLELGDRDDEVFSVAQQNSLETFLIIDSRFHMFMTANQSMLFARFA